MSSLRAFASALGEMMVETNSEQSIGRHRLRIEQAILVVRFIGDLSRDEGRKMLAMCEQIISQHGHAYLLAFADEAASIDAEFRRELVHWMKTNPLLAVANVRVSLIARTVGVLLSNAFRLMGVAEYASAFFDNEEGARRWIATVDAKRREPNRPAR